MTDGQFLGTALPNPESNCEGLQFRKLSPSQKFLDVMAAWEWAGRLVMKHQGDPGGSVAVVEADLYLKGAGMANDELRW